MGKSAMFFNFKVLNYHTDRQGGQNMDIDINYKYKQLQSINYLLIRNDILKLVDVSVDLDQYWETLARIIGDTVLIKYNKYLNGIIVKLTVLPSPIIKSPYEPGFHGPIYIKGDMKGFLN